jgi:recombinational DNA repair ATPase RecF
VSVDRITGENGTGKSTVLEALDVAGDDGGGLVRRRTAGQPPWRAASTEPECSIPMYGDW